MTKKHTVIFTAQTIKGPVEVTGTLVQFGFVLHARIRPSNRHRFTISDPISGTSVAHGPTEDEAVAKLILIAQKMGGSQRFMEEVEAARARSTRFIAATNQAIDLLKPLLKSSRKARACAVAQIATALFGSPDKFTFEFDDSDADDDATTVSTISLSSPRTH